MDEQELLKERFKSAVSSAVKAISENFNLEIKFGNKTTTKKDSLNLPEIVKLKKLQDEINIESISVEDKSFHHKNLFWGLQNYPKKVPGPKC